MRRRPDYFVEEFLRTLENFAYKHPTTFTNVREVKFPRIWPLLTVALCMIPLALVVR